MSGDTSDRQDRAADGVVRRKIVRFDLDERSEWVARLDCGHGRHVRHRPPLADYPWIEDEAGRAAKIGAEIECGRCARLELPTGALPYRSTDEFDETSLPAGLRRAHSTRPGVWGRAEVLAGQLRFVMPALGVDRVIEAGDHAVIVPEIEHHVEPVGPMRMRVVFLRAPA